MVGRPGDRGGNTVVEIFEPEAVGLDPDKVDALVTRVRREVDEGTLPSCQIALARHGRVGVAATFGAPEGSRYVIFSATKPVVATAVWMQIDEGLLRLDDRISDHIPEFASNGKDVITLEQVLLHTSGFPHAPLSAPDWDTRESRVAKFGSWRLSWEPGSRFEYHATSAHWVLAELIARTSGLDHREFIRQRIIEPLGLQRFRLGVPAEEQHDINDLATVGTEITPEEFKAALGFDMPPPTEVTPAALLGFNIAEVRALGVPGGGGVSDAADLAMFYQALLAGAEGLLSPEALHMMTSEVRNHFPTDLGVPANRALGTVVAGADGNAAMRGLGRTVSPRAFGHNGAAGQIAWGDPETGLSFVYLTNGVELNVLREARRGVAIASRAGECALPA